MADQFVKITTKRTDDRPARRINLFKLAEADKEPKVTKEPKPEPKVIKERVKGEFVGAARVRASIKKKQDKARERIERERKRYVNPLTGNIVKETTIKKAKRKIAKIQKLEQERLEKFEELFKRSNDFYIKRGNRVFKIDETVTATVLIKEFEIERPEAIKIIKSFEDRNPTKITNNLSTISYINDLDIIEYIIKVKIIITFSQDVVTRTTSGPSKYVRNIENPAQYFEAEARRIAILYASTFGHDNFTYRVLSYDITAAKTKARYDIRDMKLREESPKVLTIFNESINMIKPMKGQNCVRSYLKKTLPYLSSKVIDKLGDESGVTPEDLRQLAIKYNIVYNMFDYSNKCISEYVPETKNKKFKNITLLSNNNHIYEIKNKYIANQKPSAPIKYSSDLNKIIKDAVISGKVPTYISINDHAELFAVSVDGKIIYTSNPEYDDMKELLKSFGIDNKIRISTNCMNVSELIEPLYVKECVKSFMPGCNVFNKGGFTYSIDHNIDEEDLITLDKVKCYSYCLKYLPYVITIDYRSSELVDISAPIQEHYLYIIEPVSSSILIPNNNIYIGKILNEADNIGLKYTIKEVIKTTKHDNPYTQMIEDIYERCPKYAKMIINVMIGKMQRIQNPRGSHYKFKKIVNADELSRCDNDYFEQIEGTKYFMLFENVLDDKLPSVFTQKPISIQIMDAARLLLYRKINAIGLTESEVIQVKTDSFTFDNSRVQYKPIHEPDNFDGWKVEEYKPIRKQDEYAHNIPSMSFKYKMYRPGQHTEIITGDAGNGKTYHVINKIIPKINGAYTVLSPSHSSLDEYRTNGIKCDVIQKYSLQNKVPVENTIIIDEVGMISYQDWGVIIKLIADGRDVYALGDFTQLLPYGMEKQIDCDLLMNSLFKYRSVLEGNQRNDFSKEYYDGLKKSKNQKYLIDEVHKHSVGWEDAEYIICYRNKTADEYNNKKLEHLGLNFDSIGSRVVCIDNDLIDKELYNKKQCVIIQNDGDNVIFDNGIKITLKELNKHFKSGYAVTAHFMQGKSIKSYHYPEIDDMFINGRSAYTIISRLKTKVHARPKIPDDRKDKKKKRSGLVIKLTI